MNMIATGLATGAAIASQDAGAIGAPAAGTALSDSRASVAGPSTADPIFAAIADHRAACIAYRQACRKEGRIDGRSPDYAAAEEASNAALHREGEVLEALLKCQPTTLAGVAAVLDHLSLPEFLIEGRKGTGMTTLEGRFECESHAARKYPGRLAAAVRKISGVAPLALAPVSADPIYAAIELHRAAWEEHNDNCSRLDDLDTPEAKLEEERLGDAVTVTGDEVYGTAPTTLAGAAALLRYVARLNDGGLPLDEILNPDTVAATLEQIAGRAAA